MVKKQAPIDKLATSSTVVNFPKRPMQEPAVVYHGNSKRILREILDNVTVTEEGKETTELRDNLHEPELRLLAAKDEDTIIGIFSHYFGALELLKEKGWDLCCQEISKAASTAKILSLPFEDVEQLYEIICEFIEESDDRGENLSTPCLRFLEGYIPKMHKEIMWGPFLEKLFEYEEDSQIGQIAMDDAMEKYERDWNENVVTLAAMDSKTGISRLPKMLFGMDLTVEASKDDTACTTPDGRVFLPMYVNAFTPEEAEEGVEMVLIKDPEKLGKVIAVPKDEVPEGTVFYTPRRLNEDRYRCHALHEFGHHIWKSFQININPEVLDYEAFGVRYIGKTRNKETWELGVEVEKDGKRITLYSLSDFEELVKYPKLVQFLHNIFDDGRVDANNVEAEFMKDGFGKNYAWDCRNLFLKRPKLEDSTLATLLEAILQFAIIGELRGEIPKGLEPVFTRVRVEASNVAYGPDTDGTDALNAAIRVYNLLEKHLEDFEEKAKKLKESEMPKNLRGSKTDPSQDKNGQTKMVNEKKGKRRKRGRPGISPMSFLNQEEGEEGESNGEPNGEGKPGKSGKPSGKQGENQDGKPGQGKKSGEKKGENADKEGSGKGKEGKDKSNEDKPGESEGGKGDKGAKGGKGGELGKTGGEESEDDEGKPAGKNKRSKGKQPQKFVYDGVNGNGKKIAGEHVVMQKHAKGKIIVPDPGEVRRIRRIFERFVPKKGVKVTGLRRGKIDVKALHRWLVKMDAGIYAPVDFFSRVVYQERDVETYVLIDLSGSTYDVRKEIYQACGILGMASQLLKDPLFVGGFSQGSHEDFIVLKDWDETEIKSTDDNGCTPIGGPVRHLIHRAEEPGRKKRFFRQAFIITDGAANVGRAPMIDAKHALEELKRKKIIAKVIGIADSEGEAASIRRNFKELGIPESRCLIISKRQIKAKRLSAIFERYYRKTLRYIHNV